MIRESVQKYSQHTAMRIKTDGKWKEYTYKDMGDLIDAAALALLDSGISEDIMIGIFASNCPEWALADFAILSVKAVSVPVYGTNTSKQVEFIVDDAGIQFMFVGTQDQYDKVLEFNRSSKKLKKIIVFDRSVKLEGDDAVYFDDFIETGKKSNKRDELKTRLEKCEGTDLATLIYTSGTTGDPKGVMLTHLNFFHQLKGIAEHFDISTKDKSLCFLPLSHAYERAWSYLVFHFGAENNYLADPKQIVETMPDVRPTAMVSVPRLYEKIYATVFDRLEKASSAKKGLFMWALAKGKEYQYKKKDKKLIGPWLKFTHALADKLVLEKIRDVVGGPKNFFSAGGAALSKDIEEFFFAAGLLVCQGYGLTETSPVITCNRPAEFKFGTVGKVISDTEIKISDKGEILTRGGNLMKGYYNNPGATAEAIVDGWFHTGDVGVIDSEGYLRITDRIKDLIITSQGKNVAPQHIETLVGMDHYIEQVSTIGDGRKYMSALVVPSFVPLEEYAKEKGIEFSSRDDLVKNPEIIKFYKERINAASKGLANYEQIKRFTLLANDFTQEGGEITPTLKIKRKIVAQKYKDVIDSMYGDDRD